MEYVTTILSISIALILIVAWSLLTVRLVSAMGIDMRDPAQRTGARFLIIAIIANILLIGVVGLVFRIVNGQALSRLGFSLSPGELAFAIGMLVVTFVIAIGFVYSLQIGHILSVQWLPDTQQMIKLPFLLGIVALFVAALQEEVVFRGFLTANLAQYGFLWALLGSAVIFTGFHFLTSRVNVFQVADWFMGGLILFVVYVVSGSIWVSTIVHFSRNLANLLVFDITEKHVLYRLDPSVRPRYKTLYTFILTLAWLAVTVLFYSLSAS